MIQADLKTKRENIRFKKRQQDLHKLFKVKRVQTNLYEEVQNTNDTPSIDEAINLLSLHLIKFENKELIRKCLDRVISEYLLRKIKFLYKDFINTFLAINYVENDNNCNRTIQRKLIILLNKIIIYDDDAYLQIQQVEQQFMEKMYQAISVDQDRKNIINSVKLMENIFIDSPNIIGNFLVQNINKQCNIIATLSNILEQSQDSVLNIECIGFFYQFIEFYKYTDCENISIVIDLFFNLVGLNVIHLDYQLHNLYAYASYSLLKLCDIHNAIQNHEKFIILISQTFRVLGDNEMELPYVKLYYTKIIIQTLRKTTSQITMLKQYITLGLDDIIIQLLHLEQPTLICQGLKILYEILDSSLDKDIKDELFHQQCLVNKKQVSLLKILPKILLQSSQKNISLVLDILDLCNLEPIMGMSVSLFNNLNALLQNDNLLKTQLLILELVANMILKEQDEKGTNQIATKLKQLSFKNTLQQLSLSQNQDIEIKSTTILAFFD